MGSLLHVSTKDSKKTNSLNFSVRQLEDRCGNDSSHWQRIGQYEKYDPDQRLGASGSVSGSAISNQVTLVKT